MCTILDFSSFITERHPLISQMRCYSPLLLVDDVGIPCGLSPTAQLMEKKKRTIKNSNKLTGLQNEKLLYYKLITRNVTITTSSHQ